MELINSPVNPFLSVSVLTLKRAYKWIRVKWLGALQHSSPGFCNVCGKNTFFLAWGKYGFNNTMGCRYCGTIARYRLLALCISNWFVQRENFPLYESLNTGLSLLGVGSNTHRRLKILDTSYASHLHRFLKAIAEVTSSEYLPPLTSGTKFLGVVHQDLMRTSFDNEMFDCILSSEVFEHIADPWKAFREVWRILKPNGVHFFTVPYSENASTLMRAFEDANGEICHVLAPAYHRNPLSIKGSLVFTEFGNDLINRLDSLGFRTRVILMTDFTLGYQDTVAFISQKAEAVS